MELWREIRLGHIGYTVGKLLGACELPRIFLMSTSSTELTLIGFLGSSL
jgi:hypothetical protein